MPTLTIEGSGPCEAEEGRRLVNAIEACGVDIGHRCGGKAKCTTCRVRFTEGEPEQMTRAEYAKLKERDLLGDVRLSCQIVVEGPMAVEVPMRTSEMGWPDSGPAPAAHVEPEAEWFALEELESES